jgi:hypothetical protein
MHSSVILLRALKLLEAPHPEEALLLQMRPVFPSHPTTSLCCSPVLHNELRMHQTPPHFAPTAAESSSSLRAFPSQY